jgi:hypothetical protein
MEGLNYKNSEGKIILSKKSWVTYIFPLLIGLAFLVLLIFTGLILSIIPILICVYIALMSRSYYLYIDENGVWVFSGIFPWNKGVRGVKWRDLDEAIFYTGLASWVLKCFTIKIRNRFTKDSEITLSYMDLGDLAVTRINAEIKVRCTNLTS